MMPLVVLGVAVMIAQVPNGTVEEISYVGGMLDAVYLNQVSDDVIRETAQIAISIKSPPASSAFLVSITGGLPTEKDPVHTNLAYVGILSVRNGKNTENYYTDGKLLCSESGNCKTVGVEFRAFIDPTYKEEDAVLNTFENR